jgi:proline dehydrogenase
MLRAALLRVADSTAIAAWAGNQPAVRAVVRRYVAGDDLEQALPVVHRLAATGARLTIDHVGEHVDHLGEAEDAVAVYRDVLAHVAAAGLPAGLSVKPTQFGLLLDADRCATWVADIAKQAADAGVHVTLDMEDHQVTEATVALVERAQAEGLANVGCALQSALHRTPEDVRRLTAAGASLRLCKGAYAEPEHLAHQRRVDIDRAYLHAARYLLEHGTHPRFATHDHRLVATIKRWAAELGRPRDSYEFQMLYGVRPEMQRALVADGYGLTVYLPFGAHWFPYFTRRLAERPANLAFFLRALASPDGR